MAAPPPVNSCSTSSTNCCCCCRSSKLRPIFDLLSNIQNLTPLKLNNVNFLEWRYQIDTILRAYDLIGYVDGSLKCPDEFIVQTSTRRKMVNPAYEIWCREDRAVMAGINTTLSTFILRDVNNCSTARQLWLVLEQNYNRYSGKSSTAQQPDDYVYDDLF